MIYHYTIPAVPPPANARLKAIAEGIGGAKLATTTKVAKWKRTAATFLRRKPGVPVLTGPVAVGLVFRFGSARRDVDSGIKDALDAMIPTVDPKWGVTLDASALFGDDRQVVALYVAKDARKGEPSLDVVVAPAAEHAEVARAVAAFVDEIVGVRR